MAEPVSISSEFGGYGWKRQALDYRDVTLPMASYQALPSFFTLYKDKMPPIWNQQKLGSCTAHGSLRAYVMDRMKLGLPIFMPSRLMQYYDSRYLEGTTLIDVGASCRDAIKSIAQWGAADEKLWPYDISKFAEKPPNAAYADGLQHKSVDYAAVPQDLYQIKAALHSGYGVVFGFSVFSNFETQTVARTGLMPMPGGIPVGGHCVCAIGWNSRNYIHIANSWGESWGDPDYPGSFWMQPDYILNPRLANDFWIIRTVQR